jgi:hypothetical protein
MMRSFGGGIYPAIEGFLNTCHLTYEEWQRYWPDETYQKTCPQSPEGGGWEKVWFKERTTN